MSVSIYTETYVKFIERELHAVLNELADARTQIKEQAKDTYFTQQRLTEERDEARAQIAALKEQLAKKEGGDAVL